MPNQDAVRPTILIVEDYELNMKLWNDILGAQGYALLNTAFGIEAVLLAGGPPPQFILLRIWVAGHPGVVGGPQPQNPEANPPYFGGTPDPLPTTPPLTRT